MSFCSQAEDDQEKDTPIEPKGPKSAWITSPAATSTGLVNEPASSMWTGSSMMSCRARRFASHTMPMAGGPMTAAAERENDGEGKSGSGRGALGGSRTQKKKTKK